MFSKACQYAIRSTIFVGLESMEGRRAGLTEISEEIASPKAFTAKILQTLVKKNIMVSVKGPFGGFEIDKARLQEIKLRDIVTAIDGDALYYECSMGLTQCSETKPCPMHEYYKEIRTKLTQMLDQTSVYDLLVKIENGEAFLKLKE